MFCPAAQCYTGAGGSQQSRGGIFAKGVLCCEFQVLIEIRASFLTPAAVVLVARDNGVRNSYATSMPQELQP
jgi:hypothetical protein